MEYRDMRRRPLWLQCALGAFGWTLLMLFAAYEMGGAAEVCTAVVVPLSASLLLLEQWLGIETGIGERLIGACVDTVSKRVVG